MPQPDTNPTSKTSSDREQADKFRDMARELECDVDEAAFEDKVRKVVTAPKPEAEGER